MIKKIIFVLVLCVAVGVGGLYFVIQGFVRDLPPLDSLKDYRPLLVSKVLDREGKQVGEFFNERRILVSMDQLPKHLIDAFLAAEDDQFYKHQGVNWQAILRAFLANLKAGQTVQGASTITQQVAKSLLLSSERTYDRKIREIFLAQKMERTLSKEEILYLYLNQIFFGNGAHGVAVAAEVYFRKNVKQLSVAESALLAALPKAPSAFSPVRNPKRAKERQLYVLRRMQEIGAIDDATRMKASEEKIRVFPPIEAAPENEFYLETLRQLLVQQVGEKALLDEGLVIKTSLDVSAQKAASLAVDRGLRELDKRQGFRRPIGEGLLEPREVGAFLLKTRNELIRQKEPGFVIDVNGEFEKLPELKVDLSYRETGLPDYLPLGTRTQGIVSRVDDGLGYVQVRVAEVMGVIPFETMKWARKPDPEKKSEGAQITKPSQALKKGDVVFVEIMNEKLDPNLIKKYKWPWNPQDYPQLALEQEPEVEGALFSLDQQTGEILAIVGGRDFKKSKFNRALQAGRQTGSSFKALVYAAALEGGYTPSTLLVDAPRVFGSDSDGDEGQDTEQAKVWKPTNHSKSFSGDITFRNALVKSLNLPSVALIEDLGVQTSNLFAQRLGVFSPLNPDFTLVLGTSSVTLYEMTKAFAHFGRLGKRVRPIMVTEVKDHFGKKISDSLSLDLRFEKELRPIEESIEKKRLEWLTKKKSMVGGEPNAERPTLSRSDMILDAIFQEDPEQLMSPQSAYLMTTLLKAVVEDPNGTGGRAREVGREVAGKTGTTNKYFDAWFVGFSAQVATGVWVGFDQEKTLGKGEVGGRSALPIWTDYMKSVHESRPEVSFKVPNEIVLVNIDSKTGLLPTETTRNVLRQAFREGTEPTSAQMEEEQENDFLKKDLSD